MGTGGRQRARRAGQRGVRKGTAASGEPGGEQSGFVYHLRVLLSACDGNA